MHQEIKKLPIEGQDEDADDFPSAKVHRRCKKTKSPILLRSKPIVKPILQWALNGRTDYDRQTFISLLLHYLQSKLIQTENKIMYLPTCIESGSNLSICQGGGYFLHQASHNRIDSTPLEASPAKKMPAGNRQASEIMVYPRYFMRIFALPESRSLVIDFSRI